MKKRKWPIEKNWNLVNLSSFHPQFSSRSQFKCYGSLARHNSLPSSILKIAGFHSHLIKNTDRNHPIDKKWTVQNLALHSRFRVFFIFHMPAVTVFTEAKRACNRATCYSLWKKIHDKLLLRSIQRASSNKCSQSLADTGKKTEKAVFLE